MLNLEPDSYDQITNIILDHLSAERQPDSIHCFAEIGTPANFVSGKEYSGGNLLALSARRFVSPWFLTFLQAKSLGGNVKRGESGVGVLKFGERKAKDNHVPDPELRETFIKRYTVFNACQIEGIEFPEIEPPHPENRGRTIRAIEDILCCLKNPPKIYEGRKAVPCYIRKLDAIEMPAREFFSNLRSYYQVLFHELTHWTGHESRLSRATLLKSSRKRGVDYAKEELVAELGSAFLSSAVAITGDNHLASAGYIEGWLRAEKLDEDPEKWIREAAQEAKKAVEFILEACK